MNSGLIFASIIVLSIMSLALFGIIVVAEKKLMPWRRAAEPTRT
jgi:ABC-type nitrate/sulfonate/bicarbonate transport system permease component